MDSEEPLCKINTSSMDSKTYKIEISDKVYISAHMNNGRVFYTSTCTFNDREQALLYCIKSDSFFVSIHGGKDFEDKFGIQFLSDTPINDIPTLIRQQLKHLDESECRIVSIHDDCYYTIEPTIEFQKEK